jgi:uncharacterized protein (TIGR02147 family)
MADDTWRGFLAAKVAKRRRKISLRALAAKAGFKSPGYIQLLLSGERNISLEAAERLCAALALTTEEKEHFLDLLTLDRNSDPRVRAIVEARIRGRGFASASRELTTDQSDLFRAWYTPLVWTLAPLVERGRLATGLARLLHPLVRAGDVERTVDRLVEGGFLRARPNGGFAHDDDLLSISTPVSSERLNRFYIATVGAFRRLLPSLSPRQRSVRVTTFSLSAARVEEAREKIRALHKELATMPLDSRTAGEPSVACHVLTAALFIEFDDGEGDGQGDGKGNRATKGEEPEKT